MNVKNEVATKLFCFLYFCWGIFMLLYQAVNLKNNFSDLFLKIVNIVVFIGLLFCYLLILQNLNFKIYLSALIGAIIFFVLSFIPAHFQLGIIMITSFTFIIVGGNLNFNSILKTFIIFSSLILFFTILLNKFNIIQDMLPPLDSNIARVRSSLGFKYYSYASHIMFYFICAYVSYKKDKISYSELIILLITNYYIFYYTDTRTSFVLGTIFVIYALIKKIFNVKKGLIKFKIMDFIYSYSFILCLIIILGISFCLPSVTFESLNALLSGRLVLYVANLQKYGISLFGQSIMFNTVETNLNHYNYIDSAYLQTLVVDGIVFSVIIIILFTIANKMIVKEKNDTLAMAMLLIAVFAMFDPQLIWPWYSPFCILLGTCFRLNKHKVISVE